MSSHPKDATKKLFDTMARCGHVAKQLHLPADLAPFSLQSCVSVQVCAVMLV